MVTYNKLTLMNKLRLIFPYIILISAILVSITGSYYSIYGIGRIFAGHQLGATCMAFALELGNIITASALKVYWKELPKYLKWYLTTAVVILSIITSVGIYGFLSDGYQMTYNKDRIIQSKIDFLKSKKSRFENLLEDYKSQKTESTNSVSTLVKSLSTDNQHQTVDSKGRILTQIQSTNKTGVQNALNVALNKVNELNFKVNELNDSISAYDLKIIELTSSNEVSTELGALKYISNLTGKDMNIVVNWFLVLLMLVFQPLAIALILASLFAFSSEVNSPNELKSAETATDMLEPKIEVLEKKPRKKREKKSSIQVNPRTFNIELEGLEPVVGDEIKHIESESLASVETVTELPNKKPRKRKIVERSLPEDLALHLSESLKKKD